MSHGENAIATMLDEITEIGCGRMAVRILAGNLRQSGGSRKTLRRGQFVVVLAECRSRTGALRSPRTGDSEQSHLERSILGAREPR